MIKVLEKRVLVEEIATKKESKLILNEKSKDVQYTIDRKVIGVGKDVMDIQVGDIPCISLHAKPHYVEIIEKTETKIVSHMVFYTHDIAGIEQLNK